MKKYNHPIDKFISLLPKDVSQNDLSDFLRLKKASKHLLGEDSSFFLKEAWKHKELLKKLKSDNDYYFFITSMIIDKNQMKKVAYPMAENYFFKNPFFGYNLQKWATCVHKIYESMNNDDVSYPEAVKKYSSNIFEDEEERNNFLNWLKYYNQGEHLRYNIKTAGYQFPVSATGDAYSSTSNYIGMDYALDHDTQKDSAKEQGEKKINYKNWKKKFNTALRRVDKILKESEDYVDPDKYEEISQILNRLDVQVAKIRLQATASDVSYRAANQLIKLGFKDGASVLYKYSQEAAPPDPVVPEAAPEAPLESPEPSPEQMAKKQQDKENIEKGKELLSGVEPIPGPSPREYEDIIKDDIDVDDAAKKLEQIAGTLSDRRVIRYLAEFDIMLDKIGIASMFPELAEAQSKLIESYSYALTRVTKMLGMLSNNKAIMEIGREEAQKEVAQPSPAVPTEQLPAEAVTTPLPGPAV
jgi:hypothetical protein